MTFMKHAACPRGRLFAVALAAGLGPAVAAARATTATYTDLYTLGTPSGVSSPDQDYLQSGAGGQLVGSGTATGNNNHAVLWSPTATGGVDLNPVGFITSNAAATSGT